jgi:hypothetical protein
MTAAIYARKSTDQLVVPAEKCGGVVAVEVTTFDG